MKASFLFHLLCVLPFTAHTQADSTDLHVRLILLDLINIDDTREAITAEFLLDTRWLVDGLRDTTLAYSAELVPRIQIRNLVSLEPVEPEGIDVDARGMAHFNQRMIGTIQQRFDFTDFPYDDQLLTIELFTFERPAYRILADTARGNGIMPGFQDLTAWDIQFAGAASTSLHGPGRSIPSVSFQYALTRHPTYYFWKVLLPVTLIVFMSWGAFWISPEEISAQLTVSVTAILTLIALQFSVSQLVPPLSYLTYLDKFSAGANFFVFLAFLESVITSYQAEAGRRHLSRKIDRVARILFPVSFILFLLLI
ncbi:MAG: hypothetical protein WA952_20035 [Lewinella sp.]